MADEDTQVREESLWWAFDAPADAPPPNALFDEPLEWPDTLPWEELGDGQAPAEAFAFGPPGDDAGPAGLDLLFPPVADAAAVVEADRPPRPPVAPDAAPTELHLEALPDSIWAADAGDGAEGLEDGAAVIRARELAIPPLYAEAERTRSGGWWSRFPVVRGNAAVVALICFVSLVLLGMFLSVRARTDVPTDTSRTTVPQDDIAATHPLNTIPLNPAAESPPATIALSDLLPPPDASADTGTTAPRAATSATTAPKAASPAASPSSTPQTTTATTAAPEPTASSTPSSTPATDDTTQTTRRTTTSFEFPRPSSSVTIPTPSSIDWPSGWPPATTGR